MSPDCDYSLGVATGGVTDVMMTSSSRLNQAHEPQHARLRLIPDVGAQGTGWIPSMEDSNSWLRIQMGNLYEIRAFVTQGCGSEHAWIVEYCLAFVSRNGSTIFYGGSSLENCQVILHFSFPFLAVNLI